MAWPRGQRLHRRPRDRARRPHPRDRRPQDYYPLRRRLWGAARGTGCASGPRARWHPAPDWDNDRHPGTGLPPVTRTGDRCHRQPSGVNAVPRGRWQPSCCLRGGMVPPPRARPRPEPARRDAAHPAPGPAVPRRLASRAPRAGLQAPRQALSAPLSATARAGPWPLPSQPRPSAGLAGQPLDGTGYGPDLCRLPATGRNRLPSMSYVPNRLLWTNTSLP